MTDSEGSISEEGDDDGEAGPRAGPASGAGADERKIADGDSSGSEGGLELLDEGSDGSEAGRMQSVGKPSSKLMASRRRAGSVLSLRGDG